MGNGGTSGTAQPSKNVMTELGLVNLVELFDDNPGCAFDECMCVLSKPRKDVDALD